MQAEITLHQLRLLREVAGRRTIAAAADSLGYTPSAVSQQLAGLERSTGIAVLERVGRNVRLTDAGRELVRHADGLLSGVEAAQVALERVNGSVQGTLEMSVYESVAATLLPPLLADLAARHPHLSIRTRQMDPDVAIDELAMGDLDLAFTIDYHHAPDAPRNDIERFTILDDHFHLAVPADDELEGTSVSLTAVAARAFIASPPDWSCGRCVLVACRNAGFEPDIVHQIDDYPTTLKLVGAGQGVALIPDLGLVDAVPGVRVLDLETPITRSVQIAYRIASAQRPAIIAVRDALARLSATFGP
jgi:DNA-binding transcriptional LysR family regulator